MAVHDRIPLIDLLRKSPANAGFFYVVSSQELNTLRQRLKPKPAISMGSLGVNAAGQ